MKKSQIILNGIFSENPTLSVVLGMCPVIIATESINNAVGMSVAVFFVLFLSNTIISAIRKLIPDEIRIPVYIVIIASLVTVIQLLMEAFTPELANSLGEFLPLITVNCIILGRAEAFAKKNTVTDSMCDAIGQSVGFFMAMILIAIPREFLGTGGFTFVNPFTNETMVKWLPLGAYNIPLMNKAVGGFLWIGIIMGLFRFFLNKYNEKKLKKEAANKANVKTAAKAAA